MNVGDKGYAKWVNHQQRLKQEAWKKSGCKASFNTFVIPTQAPPSVAPPPSPLPAISKLSTQVINVTSTVSKLEEKTEETQNNQIQQAARINLIAVGQESTSSTVNNVAAKVGEQGEIQNRLAAQLSEKTAALRLLEEKMETLQIKNHEQTETSSRNEEKIGALIDQNREALAKAEEEKRRREELEEQVGEMNNNFREMKMLMEATKAELQEVKRQTKDQQVAQARQESAHANIDLKLRRNIREFPHSRTDTHN